MFDEKSGIKSGNETKSWLNNKNLRPEVLSMKLPAKRQS